jgi:hypothetical protein
MYSKEAEIFVDFFGLFLDVVSLIISLNGRATLQDVLTLALSSFPQLEMMKRAIPVAKRIVELRWMTTELKSMLFGVIRAISATVKPSRLISLDDLQPIMLLCESVNILLSRMTRKLEDTKVGACFLLAYESFCSSFAKEPETPIQYRQDTTISALVVENFPRFSAALLSFAKFGMLSRERTPHLFLYWIQFIRSVILNEEVDRPQTFRKLLESIPFPDFSPLLYESMLNLKLIGGLVSYHAFAHPDEDCTPLTSGYYSLQAAFLQTLASGNGDYTDLDAKSKSFLAVAPRISATLFAQIERLWPFVARLILTLSTFQTFQLMVRLLRVDLLVDGPEPPVFGCFFVNYVVATMRTLDRAAGTDLLPRGLAASHARFDATIHAQLASAPPLITSSIDQFLAPFAVELENAKKSWTVALTDDIPILAGPHLLSLISGIAVRGNQNHLQTIQKLEEVGELIMGHEGLDAFAVLSQVFSIFQGISPELTNARPREAANQFRRILEYGLFVLSGVAQLANADMFLAKILCEKQVAPEIVRRQQITSEVDRLPGLLAELESAVADDQIGPAKAEFVEALGGAIAGMLSDEAHRGLEEGQLLIQENRILFERLRQKREEANRQRIAFLRFQRAMLTTLDEQQRDYDMVRSRIARKTLKLERANAEITQKEAFRADLNKAVEEMHQAPAAVAGHQGDAEKLPEPSSDADLASLNQTLRTAMQENTKMRDQLTSRGLKIERGLKDFQGEVAVLQDDDNDADDEITEEMQNKIEEKVLASADAFRSEQWTDDPDYERMALDLLRGIDRLICLHQTRKEKTKRLKNRISAINRSVANTRSALMGILDDDL